MVKKLRLAVVTIGDICLFKNGQDAVKIIQQLDELSKDPLHMIQYSLNQDVIFSDKSLGCIQYSVESVPSIDVIDTLFWTFGTRMYKIREKPNDGIYMCVAPDDKVAADTVVSQLDGAQIDKVELEQDFLNISNSVKDLLVGYSKL